MGYRLIGQVMANLSNIQHANSKTGLTLIGRVVRGADLYYNDFVTGGNTFLVTDSANTRTSMPARSAPQDYIYESVTFDIETWDDGFYEWQVYDTIPTPANGKLLALSRFYIANGKIMFDDYLFNIQTNLAGVRIKTDNLPADPASETNATDNKDTIISEIDDNEVKIDILQSDVTAIKAKTVNLPSDPTSEAIATANKNSIIFEINENETKIDAIDAALAIVDGIVDLIKVKTDNLPTDPTSETNATANRIEVITEVDDNGIKIDLVQSDVITIEDNTEEILTKVREI